MKRELRVGRKAGRTSWRTVRPPQRGRGGQGWPPGTPGQPKPEKVRRQRKKFEDAKEVLVGSTQDEDVGVLVGGTLRRLVGRGKIQEQALPNSGLCSEMKRGGQGSVSRQKASPFPQSSWYDAAQQQSGAQVPGYRLNKGPAGTLQCPSIPLPLEPQFSHQ